MALAAIGKGCAGDPPIKFKVQLYTTLAGLQSPNINFDFVKTDRVVLRAKDFGTMMVRWCPKASPA